MFPSLWKIIVYAMILLIGSFIAAPNLFTKEQLAQMPDWFPTKQVTLGLDLRGGSHLVLEVDTAALKKERMESLAASARKLLRTQETSRSTIRLQGDTLVVKVYNASQMDAVKKQLQELDTSRSTFGIATPDIAIENISDSELHITLTEAMLNERISMAIEQSLEIVRKRIDEVGVAEPSIQRMGQDRIVVQLPGVQDPGHIKELLGSTAKLSFHLLDSDTPYILAGQPRPATVGKQVIPSAEGDGYYVVERAALVLGERLMDARASTDPQTGRPVVSFRFDPLGAQQFGKATTENVGKPFAIVLDSKVLSAPIIQEPILGGSGQITGSFTPEQTANLSALLRAGALPAPLHIIEERTVGPDLGADAIEMGAITGLLGFMLVFAFMLVLYGRWGLVANFALLMNVVLTFAALTLLGATLTLPGIAGIVLGIGLAVDANVLINERIREETKAGRSAIAALDAGFQKAYSTIIDSNVTTLIATLLLFAFGSGPVKGFAITMGIGIAISMFTAVAIVRVIMAMWVKRKRPTQFIIQPVFGRQFFTDEPNIPFMKARFFGLGISLFLSVASVVLFIVPGLNYGIDFKGGIVMEVETPEKADLAKMRATLDKLHIGEVGLQEFGSDSTILVRIEQQAQDEKLHASVVEDIRHAIENVQPGSDIERVEVVGPKLSDELAYKGILAVVLASAAMLLYIWFRFEWQFAIGAIATLVLDVTKTVGFFALTGLDFNLTAIAALLTLIGYSVNDKVVVYDRMRENLRRYKKLPLRDLIDLSINQTLKRSLYTSVTAFLAMLPMAMAGGSAVSSFAIPMLFGIFIAASSSVFIAAPILLYFGEGRLGYRKPADELPPTQEVVDGSSA